MAASLLLLCRCVPFKAVGTGPDSPPSLIVAVRDNITVSDERMLHPVFGKGDAQKQIQRLFTLNLPKKLKDTSIFEPVNALPSLNDSSFVPTKLPWRKSDSLTFMLPTPDAPPFTDSTDYTLFIQNIWISGKNLFPVIFFVSGKGSFNIKPLTCHALYTLWDNRTSKPVIWGKVRTDRKFYMSKCSWVEILMEIADRIVDGTPFDEPDITHSTSHIDSYDPKYKDCHLEM